MRKLYHKLTALHRALAAIPKYVLLDEAGEPLPHDAPTHAAVLIPMANLIVWPHSLGGDNSNHDACEKLCRDLRAMGRDDWRMASEEDWRHIRDLTRCDPAVDASIFHGIKPRWHWTSTALSGYPGAAWLVGADYGDLGNDHRNGSGFALAVRSAGQ